MLLQAYDDEDPDTAKRALASPFIRHMDVEYSKLALIVPLPQGLPNASKPAVIKNATASYTSPNVEVRNINIKLLVQLLTNVLQATKSGADDGEAGEAGEAGAQNDDDDEEGGLC